MPFVQSFFSLLLRLVLLAAGLVVAAAIALLVTLLLGVWWLRAGWARLTGRPVMPFATRFGARHAFEEMMRRAPAAPGGSRTPRADAGVGPRGGLADVTDVEPK